MSGAVKAAIAGGAIAVVLALGAIAAVTTGLVDVPTSGSQPDRMVVIATAPAEDGSEFAPLAYVADPVTGQVTLLDSLEDATVSGTSAKTAAEALAFGGGDAVASALKAQTGGEALDWILIPSSAWANLIDRAGGVTVDVPVGVSAYGNGQLTLLAPGRKELTGAESRFATWSGSRRRAVRCRLSRYPHFPPYSDGHHILMLRGRHADTSIEACLRAAILSPYSRARSATFGRTRSVIRVG